MTNTNDQRILDMKKQIEAKKEQLGKATRFVPTTNMIIELYFKVKTNIQTLTKEELRHLLVQLNSFKASANNLGTGVLKEYTISGYHIDDWIGDVKAKLENLSRKDEEKKLKLMEEKLVQLLSEGKKVELEIDEIANLLND